MGLDVYLYKYDDMDAVKQRREVYDTATTKAWTFGNREYSALSQEEKDTARKAQKAAALEIGLSEGGNDPQEHKVEIDSRLYSDHMFKVGYFRSSYNEGGFNRVMPPICGTSLNDLFPSNEYEFRPDWADSRRRAIAALERAREWLAINGAYQVATFSNNMFTLPAELPASIEAALAIFTEEAKRHKDAPSDFESYSRNGGGDVLPKAANGSRGRNRRSRELPPPVRLCGLQGWR